jgi:hypothetical protein
VVFGQQTVDLASRNSKRTKPTPWRRSPYDAHYGRSWRFGAALELDGLPLLLGHFNGAKRVQCTEKVAARWVSNASLGTPNL